MTAGELAGKAAKRQKFYDSIRPLFGKITPKQTEGMEAILDEWDSRKFTDLRWLAYILATVFHETGRTMQPVKEYGGEIYLKTKKYYPYYGRDLVQTTWLRNYQKVKAFTGVDVVKDPEKIGELKLAAKVAIEFMNKGYYTGKKLSDYFNEKSDWKNARKIINGLDQAATISVYGLKFYAALI